MEVKKGNKVCPDCNGQGWHEVVPDFSGRICKTCQGLQQIPKDTQIPKLGGD